VSRTRHNAFQRLYRGETSFDFAGRWRIWFAISGLIIAIGLVSLGVRGLNFSIDFKGGTVWEVPSTASVSHVRDVVGGVSSAFRQADIQVLTNRQTGARTIKVEAAAKETSDPTEVAKVTDALAKMAGVSPNEVQINDVGPSWGSDITRKAIEAVVVFLIVVALYIWLRFEGKMAIAALTAVVHDILLTAGIYSLSGFQVSPDTVIAFLTILGYSLYDTIVVFDKVQENTRGLASTNRLTYTDTVNISMNQVLARSINTSIVAIIPILSILVIGGWLLGATALNDFGLALFVGLTTGAYSSIFIASPLLALLKEREPRYAEIRRRLATAPAGRRITPAAVAVGDLSGRPTREPAGVAARSTTSAAPEPPVSVPSLPDDGDGSNGSDSAPDGASDRGPDGSDSDSDRDDAGGAPLTRTPVPPRGNRPPPRPRKKGRRR
jgi:preprotein translocase subunit SecF